MGGGQPSPPPAPAAPPAPSPAETTRQALQAELEFAPQFREEEAASIIRLAEAFGTAFTETGIPLAREQRDLQRELDPEIFATQEAVAEEIQARLADPISDESEALFTERFAEQEALAGRLGSPIGSASVARQLFGAEEAIRSQAQTAALSFLGKTPPSAGVVPGVTQVPGGTPQFGSLVAPNLQATSSIFGSQAGFASDIFGAQTQFATGQLGRSRSGVGQFAGQAVSAKIFLKCVPEGTKIDTLHGQKDISEIESGDTVLDGMGHPQRVLMKYEFGPTNAEYISLKLDSGKSVIACDKHRVEGKRMKSHRVGDIVGGQEIKEVDVFPLFSRQFDLLTTHPDGGYGINGVHIESMIPDLHEMIRQIKTLETEEVMQVG